jgi:NodT family efflux transporter outer membrane factor (OMF) lipoprotein
MRSRAVLGLICLLATLLASCTVGPKYTKPSVPQAPAYSEQPPASFTESGNWKQAQPSDGLPRGKWYELFGDSQLNALEEQVPLANQTLKAAEASFRRSRALVQLNQTFLYPTFGTPPSIGSARISQNNPTGLIGATYGLFSLPVQASYEADLWGRIRRQINSAKEQYQATAADLENVKLSLQTELALDYFDARSLDLQKQILDNTVVAFQKAYDLTQNRFNGGIASKAEVTQAQTQLNQTQAQDIDVSAARANFDHAIAVLIGKTPEEFRLPPAPLNQTPPVIPVGVPSQLLERRPDVAFQERLAASANEQIGIARAAYFPQLILTATGGFQSGSIVNWFTWPSRFWSVGPQMAETIFDFGRRRAQVASAQANFDIAIANYRQASLTAFQQVEDNLSTLRILEQESAKQHEATLAAQASLDQSINRYKGGLVTYLEVITAQSIALTNQRTEADLLRRRMNASVALIQALGGGWDTSQLPKA